MIACTVQCTYNAILKTLGITNNEEDETINLGIENYVQLKCCVETKEAKVLWNIPLHLDVVPKYSANEPDIAICNKKEVASGSYLKELYVILDRFKKETKQRNMLI